MSGRHDKEQQVWIDRKVYDLIQPFVKPRGPLVQRKFLDRAITQYCRQCERRKTKAKARKDSL